MSVARDRGATPSAAPRFARWRLRRTRARGSRRSCCESCAWHPSCSSLLPGVPGSISKSMDLYLVSLATGAVGLGIMGIGGLSHGSHAGHGNAAHGHAGHAHAGHAHGSSASTRDNLVGTHIPAAGWRWTSLLSPRVLFSLMVGFGAGGLVATPLGKPWQLGAAILGAAIFETAIVGPLWRFLFRFESRAAATLESSIEDEARAVTGFDANGRGLVAVEVDGQVVQLLATLAPDERARGTRIRSGDLVRIAEVDAARGRCTVTQPTR